MTRQQIEDMRDAAELLDSIAKDAVKLRDNPDHLRGAARREELFCILSIMEIKLHAVSGTLRDIANQDSSV